LRLKTTHGGARTAILAGLLLVAGVATELIVASLQTGIDTRLLSSALFQGAVGAGLFAWGALRLPSWARLRSRQMEEVGARLQDPSGP
jgi:hypothetical protein